MEDIVSALDATQQIGNGFDQLPRGNHSHPYVPVKTVSGTVDYVVEGYKDYLILFKANASVTVSLNGITQVAGSQGMFIHQSFAPGTITLSHTNPSADCTFYIHVIDS